MRGSGSPAHNSSVVPPACTAPRPASQSSVPLSPPPHSGTGQGPRPAQDSRSGQAPAKPGTIFPPPHKAIYSWGSTALGAAAHRAGPLTIPGSAPRSSSSCRPQRSCWGQRPGEQLSLLHRAAHTPVRLLAAPGWVGLGLPGARCPASPPETRACAALPVPAARPRAPPSGPPGRPPRYRPPT